MDRRAGRASSASSWLSTGDSHGAHSYGQGTGERRVFRSSAEARKQPVDLANSGSTRSVWEKVEVLLPEGLWIGPFIGLRGSNLQWLKRVSGARRIDHMPNPSRFEIYAARSQQAVCAAQLLRKQINERKDKVQQSFRAYFPDIPSVDAPIELDNISKRGIALGNFFTGKQNKLMRVIPIEAVNTGSSTHDSRFIAEPEGDKDAAKHTACYAGPALDEALEQTLIHAASELARPSFGTGGKHRLRVVWALGQTAIDKRHYVTSERLHDSAARNLKWLQRQLQHVNMIKFWKSAIEADLDSLKEAVETHGFLSEPSGDRSCWLIDLAEPEKLQTHSLELTRGHDGRLQLGEVRGDQEAFDCLGCYYSDATPTGMSMALSITSILEQEQRDAVLEWVDQVHVVNGPAMLELPQMTPERFFVKDLYHKRSWHYLRTEDGVQYSLMLSSIEEPQLRNRFAGRFTTLEVVCPELDDVLNSSAPADDVMPLLRSFHGIADRLRQTVQTCTTAQHE